MSVKIMSAIFETEFRDLVDSKGDVTKASTAKLVLLAMADHANDEGEGSYPSIETLVRKTALSPQTIRNTWDALKFNGIIFLAGESKYRTNNHTIETKAFPRLRGELDGFLTLHPLEGLTGGGGPSNQSLLTLNPLDPNHQLTINKTVIPLSIENSIFAGVEITDIEQEQLRTIATRQFENALGFSKSLPWWDGDKDWRELGQWVLAEYKNDKLSFGEYNIWRNTKYTKGGITNSRLRGFPSEFYDSWDMFKMSKDEQPKIDAKSEHVYIRPPERIKNPRPANVPPPRIVGYKP